MYRNLCLIVGSLFCFSALFLLFYPLSANAAAGGHVIELQQAIQYGITLVFAIISAVAVWFVGSILARVRKRFGLQVDAEVRAYLDTAIVNAVRFAEGKAREWAHDIDDPEIKSEIVADAANYVTKNVPDALKHFGVTPDNLSDLIHARLQTTNNQGGGHAEDSKPDPLAD